MKKNLKMIVVKFKNIFRHFSGAVVGSVGSVQFQRAACSSLYLSSRSTGPLQWPVIVNYRTLMGCPCHFQSSSFFFILASSVCKSLQCQISTLTERGEGGHLFRLTCSVVLWGGRDTASKYHWCVLRVLTLGLPQSKATCASRV